jgi:MFS family permease
VVQGAGGGLMLPILQTLLLRAAGGRQIGRLMAVVTLPAEGSLTDRVGPRPVVLAGVALTALGTLPFAVTGAGPWVLAAALVVRGAGLSAANMAVMVGAFRDLDRDQIPHASSTTRIMQQVGGSFGGAVLAVILQRQFAGHPGAVAFGHTFAWALAFTALAVVPALLLPRMRVEREATAAVIRTSGPHA